MKTIKECISYAYKNVGKAELTGVSGIEYQPWTARVPFRDSEPWDGCIAVKAGTRSNCTRIVNKSRFAVGLWYWFNNWNNPSCVDSEEIRVIVESSFHNEFYNPNWDWQKELRSAIKYLKAYQISLG